MNPWGNDKSNRPKSAGLTERPDPRREEASFRYKPPGPVVRSFMRSDAPVRALRGPVGSGKSTACCAELMRRASMQEMASDEIRYTRAVVVRNTAPELRTTTIKTWLQTFPEHHWGRFRWSSPFTHHIRKGDLDFEVIFLALDQPEDIRRLLSLEVTFGWINEAREVSKSIVDGVTMRVGRYPPVGISRPTWYGTIMDTNPPADDHWWPILAGESEIPEYIPADERLMLQRPEGWEFYNQPGAMVEILDPVTKLPVRYDMNPEAENVVNLPEGYYTRMIEGKTRSWISIYVLNKLGQEVTGKPIYENFSKEVHVSPVPLKVDPALPFFTGFDFGLSPAMLIAQRSAEGQWRILREAIGQDMGASRFSGICARALEQLLPRSNWRAKMTATGDPAGDNRDQGNDEKTAYRYFHERGIMIAPARTNDTVARIEAVSTTMARMDKGIPALLIDPSCRVLIAACESGYRYRRLQVSGAEPKFESKPEKNRFSHVAEALQYLLLGGGEGQPLPPPSERAKTRESYARLGGFLARRRERDRETTRRERRTRL